MVTRTEHVFIPVYLIVFCYISFRFWFLHFCCVRIYCKEEQKQQLLVVMDFSFWCIIFRMISCTCMCMFLFLLLLLLLLVCACVCVCAFNQKNTNNDIVKHSEEADALHFEDIRKVEIFVVSPLRLFLVGSTEKIKQRSHVCLTICFSNAIPDKMASQIQFLFVQFTL